MTHLHVLRNTKLIRNMNETFLSHANIHTELLTSQFCKKIRYIVLNSKLLLYLSKRADSCYPTFFSNTFVSLTEPLHSFPFKINISQKSFLHNFPCHLHLIPHILVFMSFHVNVTLRNSFTVGITARTRKIGYIPYPNGKRPVVHRPILHFSPVHSLFPLRSGKVT